MKETLPPPLADKKQEIPKNENSQNAEKKKIIPKEVYADWVLLHDRMIMIKEYCSLLRRETAKVASDRILYQYSHEAKLNQGVRAPPTYRITFANLQMRIWDSHMLLLQAVDA